MKGDTRSLDYGFRATYAFARGWLGIGFLVFLLQHVGGFSKLGSTLGSPCFGKLPNVVAFVQVKALLISRAVIAYSNTGFDVLLDVGGESRFHLSC